MEKIEEKEKKALNGIGMLLLLLIIMFACLALIPIGAAMCFNIEGYNGNALGLVLFIFGCVWVSIGWIFFLGFRIVGPNQAIVVTLFGKYKGSLKKPGFYYINPFSSTVNPGYISSISRMLLQSKNKDSEHEDIELYSKKLSLKTMTLVNKKQKINDELGNPIEVGIVVVWQISNTAKACFNVENYRSYVSTQADSALRDVVRTYPYDISNEGDEKCLRASSQEVAEKIKEELQRRVEVAGITVCDARITHLAYATEIAAAMLQRQQATAIIEARQKIVEGAVGMVQMALEKLTEGKICELDEERKAQMVSNLLVVLCGNKDAQPIVNSGSIY